MGYAFISYSHADKGKVFPIIKYLQQNKVNLWYDKGIEVGEEWPEKIGKALNDSAYMLVFMSQNSNNSQNCRNEINMGLKLKKPMLIVYLEEFEMSYGMTLQIDTIQSVRRENHPNEESFYAEILNSRIVKQYNGVYEGEEIIKKKPISAGGVVERKGATVFQQTKKEIALENDEAKTAKRMQIIISLSVIALVLLIGFFIIVLPKACSTEDDLADTNFEYILVDDKLEIVGINAGYESRILAENNGVLNIPNEIDGKTVAIIGKDAFKTSKATKIIIPNTVSVIKENSFDSLENLQTIEFEEGSSLKEIKHKAFANLEKLDSVEIPSNIINIGQNAFLNCNSLEKVYFYGEVEDWCKIDFATESSNPLSNGAELYVNKEELLTSLVIPDSVSQLGTYFSNCTSIETVITGNFLESIEAKAFYNCTSLEQVKITNCIKRIGKDAFYGCNNLQYYNENGALYLGKSIDEGGEGLALIDANSVENSTFRLNQDTFVIADNAVSYNNLVSCVKIPEKVRYIGAEFLFSCNQLTEIYFDNNSELLGVWDKAFENCVIERATIPTSATSFIPKTNLKEVVINGGTIISNQAFEECYELEKLTIGETVLTIGDGAFNYCGALNDLSIASGVETIGQMAFLGCYSLSQIDIPNSVTSIGDSAFSNCSSFNKIEVPDSVASIGSGAFANCENLTEIKLSPNLENIGDRAFYNCPIEKATIPILAIRLLPKTNLKEVEVNGGNSIDEYKFKDFSALESVVIGESVQAITNYVFSNCTALNKIELSNGLQSLGYCVFEGCTSLKEIEIPSSITSVSSGALINSSIEKITLSTNLISSLDYDQKIKEVIINSGEELGSLSGWEVESLTIGDSVKRIVEGAFANCTKLTSVYYKGQIEDWCNIEFNYDSSNPLHKGADLYISDEKVTNLVIPGSAQIIKDYAFYGANFNSVEVKNGVQNIGAFVFYGCNQLESVSFEEDSNLEDIGSYAFAYCESLKSITIPNSVISIGSGAFSYCSNLTSIEIPNSVTDIGSRAFAYCEGLKSITIPNSVTRIDDYAFEYCKVLTEIEISSSITSIGKNVFQNCPIEKATIPASATSFIPKTNLKEVIINGGESIPGSAFYGCSSLLEITIPNSITSIDSSAFYGCTSLIKINYTGTKEEWKTISKGSGWETGTGNYTVYCVDGNLEKAES